MVKKIHYFNSYGCKITFIDRHDNMIVTLKRRKFVYVLPEVIEIVERSEKSIQKEVTVENVSYELSVHPSVIFSVFMYLKHIGLLGKEELLPNSEVERSCGLVKKWVGNVYPILRSVKEEDYGKNIKNKKEQTKNSSTA